jgi:predicted secreted Zn-dependent protease
MIEEINGYYFYWNIGSDKTRQFGFSAQEVEKVLPEIVSKGDDGLLSLDYGKVTPLLVEAIKEQQQQIDSYKSENDNLKIQLLSLQEKVDKIEGLLAKTLDE